MPSSPHLDLRVDQEVLDRLDRLAPYLSRPGLEVSRSGAARVTVLRGLDITEAEHGLTGSPATAAPKGAPAPAATATPARKPAQRSKPRGR
jgi:hypothetical protein